MEALSATHDIEAHIPSLRKLDEIRRTSAALRDRGVKALGALVDSPAYDSEGLIHRIAALRVYSSLFRGQSSRKVEDLIKKISVSDVFDDENHILTAAQVMRAAAVSPVCALSKATLGCWYLILLEIYTIYPNEFVIGCARVGRSGWPTAYTTAQAMKGVLALEDVLNRTALFFEVVDKVRQSLKDLECFDATDPWCRVERSRIEASSLVSLCHLKKGSALVLNIPEASSDLPDYLSQTLPQEIVKFLDEFRLEALRAVDEIREHRAADTRANLMRRREGDEQADEKNDELLELGAKQLRSSIGHETGLSAVSRVVGCVENAIKKAGGSDWGGLALAFREAAITVRTSVFPCRTYLSMVIDRQIAARTTHGLKYWEPGELAFAAAAYCEYEKPKGRDQERIQLAAEYVSENIGSDGVAYPRKPFHRSVRGDMIASPAFVLNSLAELLLHTKTPISEHIAVKLLPYFEERAIFDGGSGAFIGWMSEYDRDAAHPKLWATANAIEALATINMVLDEGINSIILDHFSVKTNLSSPTLDELFYPDYGLAAIDSNPHEDELRRETVALAMERMRAHIIRAENSKKLHSLVLHGPAGTGKTTLLEALAKSCSVPLVEVTPSDISKEGADGIEQRARAVFEALSYLTRVVILFDEFDPVLRRREPKIGSNFNIFSFLTPGMLPKLKALSESAERRSVVYALITNHIGSLDEAAVRQGRFDAKIGIYPPDPLSRFGFFKLACEKYVRNVKGRTIDKDRLADVIAQTAGLGMTVLMSKGWFRPEKAAVVQDKPMDYVCSGAPVKWTSMPEPEDKFDVTAEVVGPIARREYLQWGWINEWDKCVKQLKPGGKVAYQSRFSETVGDWWNLESSNQAIVMLVKACPA